jgi:hypothetical protein
MFCFIRGHVYYFVNGLKKVSQRFASAEKARRVVESATVITLDGLVLGAPATDR